MDDRFEDVDGLIYLDNAATVFPKPAPVLDRALELYKRFGVNPGRSGYDLCVIEGHLIDDTRRAMTRFFGGTDWTRLCFANNCSEALNTLIQGMVRPGDHVISTAVEHNSVIRPLRHLERDGVIAVDFAPAGSDCRVDPDEIARRLRPNTRLVVINHGSNVVGAIQPVADIARIAREAGARVIVDTAQTAGVIPVDAKAMGIDAIAFTGHKSLLGPTGIGGVYVAEGVDVRPTRFGGTGVRSANPFQLDEYPYRLEVGTPNVFGIIALGAAQTYLAEQGVAAIHEREMAVLAELEDGLAQIPNVTLHGPRGVAGRLPVLSATIDGLDPGDIGTILDVDHKIACRTGLQCAPLMHEHLGTAPRGTVRLSIGPSNTKDDAHAAVRAFERIARDARRR